MPYEEGMQIVFDLVSRTTVVCFRETIEMFGPFDDRWEAIHAGEQFCRDNGWIDTQLIPLDAPLVMRQR
jgi:hypothetical protein